MQWTVRGVAAAIIAATSCVLGPGARAQSEISPADQARWLIVHCGTLLADARSPAQSDMTLVVGEGRIVGVHQGLLGRAQLDLPANDAVQVLDLSDRFVLPGLIDCHAHIQFEWNKNLRLGRVQSSEADHAIRAAVYARRTLAAGVTTIRDLGSSGDTVFALRDAIAGGLIPGPRILAAGQAITPTGGHSDDTHGYREDLFTQPGAMEGIGDGVDGCRKAVRAQVKRGADVIKLTATGGVLSATNAGIDQQFFDDELAAIVATAHFLGRKVAAHAHGNAGIKAALRAGVDSIEHGSFLDEQAIALMRERGVWLVPTLLAGEVSRERAAIPGYFPDAVVDKIQKVVATHHASFTKAVEAGVPIAFGTDSGVSEHGRNAEELLLMVRLGMTPRDALVAATVNAAELLGLGDEIGTLAVGKAADLIATQGDPLDDIAALGQVDTVVRGGVVYQGDW